MLNSFTALGCLLTCALATEDTSDHFVPALRKMTAQEGPGFTVAKRLPVRIPEGLPSARDHILAFADAVGRLSDVAVTPAFDAPDEPGSLVITLEPSLAPEEYRLNVGPRVSVQVSSLRGLAHATATLLQCWRPVGETLPARTIVDAPVVPYRSFMVDVGRNAHSLDALKETVDLLWFYKVESLHLHLTDDQRWAFPSRAFPKLASEGSISREGWLELERYAAVRGVTVIPELEAPGHSTLLRRHYPDIFGASTTETASLPSSRAALKTLLDEMVDVFASSPFVHVGGDEAYGVPLELQRDLVNELHDHLETRGKTTLVWEGPALGTGDNKVREDVVHLNWRTVDVPAQEMLEAGYPVVNAAWDPLYLVDHYPRNNFTMASPQHIYETLDRFLFRHYNPGMRTFSEPVRVEPTDQVIGYCMPWWEGRETFYFPLVVPRLIPMADVAWSEPTERDYAAFTSRVEATEARRAEAFAGLRIDAAPLAVESAGVFHRTTTVRLAGLGVPPRRAVSLRYTLDGSAPTATSTRYDGPFTLNDSAVVRAAMFTDHGRVGHGARRTFVGIEPLDHLALGKPVTSSKSGGPTFCVERLTDGGIGNLDYYLGYPAMPEPIDLTMDLGAPTSLGRVDVHTYVNGRSYESYEVSLSLDGETFHTVASRRDKPEALTSPAEHRFDAAEARYVRVRTHGHKGQVFDSFSRITEIAVYAPQ